MMDTRDTGWETLAREGRLADAIEAYVRQYDWVTLVELKRKLKPHNDVSGEWTWQIDENLVLWSGLSEACIDALQQVCLEKRVHAWPTSLMVYLIDGGLLKLPIAKRSPKGGYKKRHWLPVCLRIEPLPEPKKRKA